ncbi:ABC transporter ATP-binding protein [Gulosibacter faecalis]|jgi:iron complex transport system ATP-binding protein|uniref:ABC transporter ATP-binding protein n=1 Tax=Gulosibacter faecalis TaxID=272240 RepID=A0ABW5UYP8_9MICO|nr:ABC transporter ATP-binding protein [Gulosibacter faecalis]
MTDVVKFENVRVRRGGRNILDIAEWRVAETDRWVILGPNGAGKSTLLGLASAHLHPSSGTVEVLGEQLGRTDVFELRPRIGIAGSDMAKRIPDNETVRNAVMTAVYAVTGRWNEQYDDIDVSQADEVLAQWQLEDFGDREFGTLSDGERKRTLIARAVMSDPELLLLDEPSAALDLGSRERLLASLSEYAQSDFAPAIIMVTHHVEEIPAGVTHALLMRDGRIISAGPIGDTLTSANLEVTFGLPLELQHQNGRYTARAIA